MKRLEMGPRGDGRLVIALAILGVLALAVWRTIEPGRYQKLTLVLLAFFALRVVLARGRSR